MPSTRKFYPHKCGKSFASKQGTEKHRKTNRPATTMGKKSKDKTKLSCECGKSFKRQCDLTKHKQNSTCLAHIVKMLGI